MKRRSYVSAQTYVFPHVYQAGEKPRVGDRVILRPGLKAHRWLTPSMVYVVRDVLTDEHGQTEIQILGREKTNGRGWYQPGPFRLLRRN